MMRSLGLLGVTLTLTLALGGCDLYFNGGDDDCVVAPDIATPDLRNPENGLCGGFGGGFGECGSGCGDCAAETQALPDWGSCFSECEGLIESSCIEQPGCRAVYNANSDVDEPPRYLECWAIAPSGPAPGTTCENLDAYECSRHDNCSAYYDENHAADPSLFFSSCRKEKTPGCYGDEECGPNGHCTTSDGECLPPPDCVPGQACPAVCFGRCVNDADICAVALCEAGTHCQAQCTAEECHPVCVPDQTCESLANETACTGRSDCRAVFNGDDCTCDANGTCECQVLTYARCDTK